MKLSEKVTPLCSDWGLEAEALEKENEELKKVLRWSKSIFRHVDKHCIELYAEDDTPEELCKREERSEFKFLNCYKIRELALKLLGEVL